MSAFLGPIHYWLYNKILLQEELTRDISLFAQEQGYVKEDRYTCADGRPLEEIIDSSNIHGWLQEHIHSAERRYAQLVTDIISADGELEKLKTVAFAFGTNHAFMGDTPEAAYKFYNDSFVNGMPCDGVNQLMDKSDDSISWTETLDVHSEYWQSIGGNSDNYYVLRSAVLDGMLDGTVFTFEETEPHSYRIYRK